ncbi:argininosuccinate lyase [Thermoplasmatales archaeon BRNA1]|nr:argininosuccinate lyase [Thermoplasmatales archaeon BRNA1]
MAGKALWSGRFSEGMDDSTLAFTSSLDVDSAMAVYDVLGSLAHVRMLKACRIIPAEDADRITEGLKKIEKQLEKGEFKWDSKLEDVHTNVENTLTAMIGPAGGKLHTGRSRNDQVATDFKMYLRDGALGAVEAVDRLISSLQNVAQEHRDTILPGFTHMQHAQPITLAQHLLAHAFRFGRDADRFMDAIERMDKCPLGSAALAGTTYPIDRKMTAELLGFKDPTENSMDSVGSRDFVAELSFDAAMTAIDVSSLCEELIYWSSQEFRFVEMDDKYSTGSSIMPQKKNPDIAELSRGKTGGIVGSLVNIMVTMKGLPLSYNRDLQEDKHALMQSLRSVTDIAEMMSKVVATMKVNEARMFESTNAGFINATDLADYLVTKGVPFREAHGIVGETVRFCIDNKVTLDNLTLDQFRKFSPLIEEDVFQAISVKNCVDKRDSYGGTSPASTDVEMTLTLGDLMRRQDAVRLKQQLIEKCWNKLLNE